MFTRQLLLSAVLLFGATAAMASPGLMVGISYNFGGNVGFTVKALTSNKQDKGVAAVGVSYFPTAVASKFGVDVSAGYNFKHGSVTAGWDFLNDRIQVGAGYVNTIKDKSSSGAAPPPVG
jgi:hypothetical protein